ncbi:MAG: hypothetical protein ACMUJM_25275 [bacterium]
MINKKFVYVLVFCALSITLAVVITLLGKVLIKKKACITQDGGSTRTDLERDEHSQQELKPFVCKPGESPAGFKAEDGCTVFRLTSWNSKAIYFYSLNDEGHVVWGKGFNNFVAELFFYDGNISKRITANSEEKLHIQINNRGEVVWQGREEAASHDDIFFYNGTKVIKLGQDLFNDSKPRLNDRGDVVWQGNDGKDSEIFFYDGNSIIQLTDDTFFHCNPSINNKREIVWEKQNLSMKRGNSEVYHFNGRRIRQFTNNKIDDFNPQINNQGEIVWSASRAEEGDSEIVLYSGEYVAWITDNGVSERNVRMNNRGEVVWEENDGNDWEIFFANKDTFIQLTDNSIDDHDPWINDKGEVVWYSTKKDCGSTISYYNGKTTIELTKDQYINKIPRINNRGDIIWLSEGRGIFLAIGGAHSSGFVSQSDSDELQSDSFNDSELFKSGSFVTLDSIIEEIPVTRTHPYIIISRENKWNVSQNFTINTVGYTSWSEYDADDAEVFLYDGNNVNKLSDNTYDDINPQINARGDVVWEGNEGSDWKIFLYKYSEAAVKKLRDKRKRAKDIRINSQGMVSWTGFDGKDWEIFLYNGKEVIQLSNNEYNDKNPQINEQGQLVWLGDNRLFFYDGIAITQLADHIESHDHFQINDQGQVIWSMSVYEGKCVQKGKHKGAIISKEHKFLYDGKTIKSDSITTLSCSSETSFHFNDLGHVVWAKGGDPFLFKGDHIIRLRNNNLIEDNFSACKPQINSQGYVVWSGDGEIFLYDGKRVMQITNNQYHDKSPKINDYGEIVWCGYDGGDWEIFLYNGKRIFQLTDNSQDDLDPQINNQGNLTWTLKDSKSSLFATKDIKNLYSAIRCDGLKTIIEEVDKIVIMEVPIIEADSYTITQITNNSYDDFCPRINNRGEIVWCGYYGYNQQRDAKKNYAEIFYYHDKNITQLTKNRYNDNNHSINNRGEIVWNGDRKTGHNEIFHFNGKSLITLTASLGIKPIRDRTFSPRINDKGYIVFEGFYGDDDLRKLILYDGNTVHEIMDNATSYESVQMNNQGEIAWKIYEKGKSTIFFYDGNKVHKIFDSPNKINSLKIDNNASLVWSLSDGKDQEIFLCNERNITKMTHNIFNDSNPQINAKGQIVWCGNNKIFFYDGNRITQIMNNTQYVHSLQINEQGHVIWTQGNSKSQNSKYTMYLYDGKSIMRFAEGVRKNASPMINNRGDIVWSGYDGKDYEIFLAQKKMIFSRFY